MKIGFDIDGVIYDFHKAIYPALVHTGLTQKDFNHFWTDEVNGDYDIPREIWEKLLHDASFYGNPPIDFVVPYLQRLGERHELYYITKRKKSLQQFTREWFGAYGIPFTKILCVEADKAPYVQELDWFVEDNPGNALKLSAYTEIVMVRKPWNEILKDQFVFVDNISQITAFA